MKRPLLSAGTLQRMARGGLCAYAWVWGPEDSIDTRILQNPISGIPLLLGLRTTWKASSL